MQMTILTGCRRGGCMLATFAGEAEFAVGPLVVQHVHDVPEHLPAVAADQDVRTACNREKREVVVNYNMLLAIRCQDWDTRETIIQI